MSLLGIILLILLGIFLFIVEFLLVPGVTVAGIGGAVLLAVSIYLAYSTHGSTVGNYTLLGTVVLIIVTLVFTLKSRTWQRLMLSSNIESKIESSDREGRIKPGDTGVTLTRLNPMGRVQINDVIIEGKSTGTFIPEHSKVQVVKVLTTQVIVKPLNNSEDE